MAELNYDKLVKLVKGDKDITQSQAAQKLGLSIGQVSMLKFCQAQVEAGAYDKAPSTAASVKKLRDSEGNRWELIAARTGLSVAAVKGKYEEAGGNAANSYTGRGRNHAASGTTSKRSTAKRSGAAASKSGTAKRSGAKSGTAKRTTAKRSTAKRGAVVRRVTRRSGTSNPS